MELLVIAVVAVGAMTVHLIHEVVVVAMTVRLIHEVVVAMTVIVLQQVVNMAVHQNLKVDLVVVVTGRRHLLPHHIPAVAIVENSILTWAAHTTQDQVPSGGSQIAKHGLTEPTLTDDSLEALARQPARHTREL